MASLKSNLIEPKIALILDVATMEGLNPGYALRVKTLRAWLKTQGELDEIALSGAASSRQGRIIQVLRAFFMGRFLKRNFDVVVVNGLGGPHMTALAWILSRSCPVILDVCDGVLLTIESQSRRGQSFRSSASRIKATLLRCSSRKIAVTYISDRDSGADATLNRKRTSSVVGPMAPVGLDKLVEFEGPASRVVVAADLNSYHNRTAFEWLLDLMSNELSGLRIAVDLYGPLPPSDLYLGSSVTYCGWAPMLSSVYEGQTAVFAPNISGMGVQNKVWEAVWAGRPVLVGEEAAGSLIESPWVHTFQSKEDLRGALLDLIQYCAPSGLLRGIATEAWPDLFTALGAKVVVSDTI